TGEQVAASLAEICGAVSCGDGVLEAGEECDDHNAISGDGCSATCAIEDCWQCAGTPSTCTPRTAGTACTPDGDPCTDDVCDDTGHCGIDSCASSTTSTSAPTTTSTSTSSSTTSTSTSTSTSSSSSTTAAPTTTTTTPTTLAAGDCAGTPDGP